jgi:hypothetical protein
MLTKAEPDIRMRDMESLLRGFAMLVSGEGYQPPMVRFLNGFSHESKEFSQKKIDYLEKLFNSFLESCKELPPKAFYARTNRFSISMYEAIFAAVCEEAYADTKLDIKLVSPERLEQLKADPDFVKASQYQTTSKENVELRLNKAKEILLK